MPVHLATSERKARQTGRDSPSVATTAMTTSGVHDHGLPAHRTATTAAAAHTAGTSMLTATTAHARPNPGPASPGHDSTRRAG